jgi:hypothetical protein
MRYNFCTLFDRHYATRGIALYRSLERYCREDFTFTILCMDSQTRDFLAKLALPRVTLVLPEDLGDAELMAVRPGRPRREFCWTCPPALMLTMLGRLAPGEIATYVDADLAFFSDPKPVYDELGDKDIAIHGHRYSPEYQASEATSGIFNVGLIAIRNAPQGRACLERWRLQCLEKCELDPENGFCGDQKYLDEWPGLYDRLVVLQHPGVCLAPWNIRNYAIGVKDGQVTVSGAPLIFYHYHSLVPLRMNLLGRCALLPSHGYHFSSAEQRLIYRPYAALLRRAQREMDRHAPGSLIGSRASWRDVWRSFRSGQFVTG